MEFYKDVGKKLFLFNLVSIFFLFLTIFAYSLIQYVGGILLNLTYMLFSDVESQNILIRILEFFLILPQFLDYAFLLFVVAFALNLIYLAWQTRTGSLMTTMLFSLVGLPIWIYFMQIVGTFKLWALRFLSSVLTNNVQMPFYSYIQENSLYFSIILFLIVIAIRTIDWENIKTLTKRGKVILPTTTREERTMEEIIKQ